MHPPFIHSYYRRRETGTTTKAPSHQDEKAGGCRRYYAVRCGDLTAEKERTESRASRESEDIPIGRDEL